jgi:hypothetical protein
MARASDPMKQLEKAILALAADHPEVRQVLMAAGVDGRC